MTIENDLKIIGGNFIYGDFPKDKSYLFHYFDEGVSRAFLVYYFMFKDRTGEGFYKGFRDHSGYACGERWCFYLVDRIKEIERAMKEAEQNFDIEKVSRIRSGTATEFLTRKTGNRPRKSQNPA